MLLRTCALVLQKEPSRTILTQFAAACIPAGRGAAPKSLRDRALNETLQISTHAAPYPKNPMDRPAAPTPNHKTSAPT